jgi:hypothetical protein
MFEEEDWVTFYPAADVVAQRLGVSRTLARKQLREVCATGLVETMKAPCDPNRMPREFWTRVAPGAWREREVDYDGPDNDGCKIVVMIREADFRDWLDKKIGTQSDRQRDAVIERYLKKGCPGKDVPWKPFCDGVRKECGATPRTRGFSDETIERIARKLM